MTDLQKQVKNSTLQVRRILLYALGEVSKSKLEIEVVQRLKLLLS